MAHRAFALSLSLSPLASNQSLFIFLTPPLSPLLSPVPISLPCSWPWVPSHAQLLNSHALPPLPMHVSRLHWGVTAAHEMWDSKGCVLALCGFARLCFLVQRPESHLARGFKWNAAKTGPKPLFKIGLLSKAALATQTVFYHRTTAFMILTNSDCFSFVIIWIN